MGIFARARVALAVSALALVAPLLTSPAGAQPAPRLDPVRLEAFVDGAVRQAMATQHIAGLSVAVVDRFGPLLVKGYGTAGRAGAVDGGTLFRVGSISKTITWIAIMQLVEQRRLSLDDPINDHLPPDLRIPDEGFREPIRVWNLMTHTAGFEDALLGVNVTQDPARALTLHDYLRTYRLHRVRPPGVLTVYSNYGAALAGAIVEHESGQAFADYAEQRILRPLGLQTATYREPYPDSFTHRGFAGPMPADVAAHASSGFRFEHGRFVEQSWEFLPHMAPAGALSASARDMAVYMHALLAPEQFARARVLGADTAASMRELSFRNDPRLGGNHHGFWDIAAPTGEFAFGHNGGMAFQQTSLGIYTQSGIGIFVALNSASLNAGPNVVATLPRAILTEYFATGTAHRAAAPDDAARYAGCYRPLRRAFHHTEQGLFLIGTTGCIEATRDGDLLIGGERYIPLGAGVYGKPDLTDRVAFAWRFGRMMLFNFDSDAPLERVRVFENPSALLLAGALALLAALVRLAGGVLRLAGGREGRADLVIDGTSLLWLVSAGLFAAAVLPSLLDFSRALLDYPGPLLPIACWLFAASALATLASAVALGLWRTRSLASGIGAAAALVLFALFAAMLWQFSLLGFSGW